MTVKMLISVLHAYAPVLISGDLQTQVFDCVRYAPETHLQPGILYVAEESALVKDRSSERGAFLVVPDGAEEQFRPAEGVVAVRLRQGLCVEDILHFTEELFCDGRAYGETATALVQTLNRSGSLQELLNEAARLLTVNLICVSPGGRIVYAYTQYPQFFNDRQFDAMPIQNFGDFDEAYGEFSMESHAASLNLNYARENHDSTPFALYDERTGKWQLRCRLYYRDKYQGNFGTSWETYDVVAGLNRSLFRLLADSIAALAANQVRGERSGVSSRDSRSHLLSDILDGNYVSKETEQSIIKSGLNYSGMRLLYLPLYSYGRKWKMGGSLREKLTAMLPNSYIFYYQRNTLIILNESRDGEMIGSTHWAELLREDGLACMVSDDFSDYRQLSKRYEQVSHAYRLKQLLDGRSERSGTFFYQDYKLWDLADSYCRANHLDYGALKEFCIPEVLRLNEYDALHDTDYYDTLSSYVKTERSLQNTAARLNLHKSTVAYRIKNISEKFGIDLSSPEKVLQYFVSFMLCDLIRTTEK